MTTVTLDTVPTVSELLDWVHQHHGQIYRHRFSGKVRRLMAFGMRCYTVSAAFIELSNDASGKRTKSRVVGGPGRGIQEKERALRRAWQWCRNADPIDRFGDTTSMGADVRRMQRGDDAVKHVTEDSPLIREIIGTVLRHEPMAGPGVYLVDEFSMVAIAEEAGEDLTVMRWRLADAGQLSAAADGVYMLRSRMNPPMSLGGVPVVGLEPLSEQQ